MRASLSTSDLVDLAECSREVLSVLDAPNTEEWACRVSVRAMALLRAERLFIVLPAERGFSLHYSDGEMQDAAAAYQTHFHAQDVWTGPLRKSLGLDVYSHEMLLRPGDERTEFWNDYILAHRLYQPAGLSCDVDGCPVPASLIGYKSSPSASPFGDRELQILRVLHPSFTAAVKAVGRLRGATRELASCIDLMPIPMLLVGLRGLLHANAAFLRTLGSVTDSVAITVTPIARQLLRRRVHGPGQHATGTVQGLGGHPIPWSLNLLSTLGASPVALVQFSIVPKLHITEATRERFRLTPRQAAVAELMSEGRTHREIAVALGIRPNTARRHWEQVFQRLGVHSRHELQRVLLTEAR